MPRANRGWHLWRDPRTGVWNLRLFEASKYRTRSTGSRDRAVAEQVLAHALIEQARPKLPASPTVASVLDAWLAHKARIGQREVTSKVGTLTRQLGWLTIADYRPAHTRSYIAARREDGRANGTIRAELGILSAALRWAASEQLIPAAPIIKHNLSSEPRGRWLTHDEAKRLLAACRRSHVRLFVLLGLHTGARTGAMLELTWDRVDFERRLVNYGVKTGGKPRSVVPINDTLLLALAEAREAATTNYVIEWGGQRVGKIRDTFYATAKRAGLEDCYPHCLRATAGHWLMQAGSSIEEVAAVLGHRSIATTYRVYARLYPEHLRAAVKRLESA
jgi:integrase